MALQLSDDQKVELRRLLENPLMQMALEDALRTTRQRKGGAQTLEAAAMAYNHQSGADDLVGELLSLADSSKPVGITMRKLRH